MAELAGLRAGEVVEILDRAVRRLLGRADPRRLCAIYPRIAPQALRMWACGWSRWAATLCAGSVSCPQNRTPARRLESCQRPSLSACMDQPFEQPLYAPDRN